MEKIISKLLLSECQEIKYLISTIQNSRKNGVG